MLSEYQQDVVWEGWLSAEIRAGYFARLVQRYQRRQQLLVLGTLLLSSGATVLLLTAVVPAGWGWIKPLLTLIAAGLSLWSLVARNERNATECADLHGRWYAIALRYEGLWSNVYAEDAGERLDRLLEDEMAVSKSSTAFPEDKKLLGAIQDNVVMHHAEAA